jgi:hypothetical protein
VFERSYRRLTAGHNFDRLVRSQCFPFARRVLLINNVEDPRDVLRRATRLLEAGELDEVHFVADHLEHALEVCDLRRSELGSLLHFCDAPIVAITLGGSPWLVYWDADATLDAPRDWVTPSYAALSRWPQLIVANPSWERPRSDGRRPGVEHEAHEIDGDFALGPGFSDQAFLVRRADLAGPIYRTRCIGTLVHPRAHKGKTFEARINAHMRHSGRLRATHLPTSLSIEQPPNGATCRPRGMTEWARYLRNAAILRLSGRSPWRPVCLRHTWIGNGAADAAP